MLDERGGTSSKERRLYIRTDSSVPMMLHLKHGGTSEEIKANTKNISATGIMVEVDKNIPIGSEVKVELTPHGSANPVHCSGKVIWTTPLQKAGRYQCGIVFTIIEEDNKNTFLKFLCDAIYRASGK